MSPSQAHERWKTIEKIFHQVMAERDPSAQRQKSIELTAGDEDLFREVWSLIEAAHESKEFLENRDEIEIDSFEEIFDELRKSADDTDNEPDNVRFANSPLPFGQLDAKTGVKQDVSIQELSIQLSQLRPDFEVIGLAGRGGAGVVFHVRDLRLARDVAVKVLIGNRHHSRQSSGLRRESLAAVVESDFVVRLYEISPAVSPLQYLVMEWVKGPSLREWLHGHGALSHREAARLMSQVAAGVHQAHLAGLTHGDIKPANVLLDPVTNHISYDLLSDFRAKISDFGFSRGPAKSTTNDQRFGGTPAYADPQRLLEKMPPSVAGDVWSLGATLYHCLLGCTPYPGTLIQVVRSARLTAPLSPRSRDPSIPRDLESICLKALSRQPENRYANAQELADDLKRFLDGRPVVARPIGMPQRITSWCHRNPVISALGALVLLLGAAILTTSLYTTWKLSVKNAEIERQTEAARLARLEHLVGGDPAGLSAIFASREFEGEQEIKFLKSLDSKGTAPLTQPEVNAAVLLALSGSANIETLARAVAESNPSPAQCQNLIRAMGPFAAESSTQLRRTFEKTSDPQVQARVATVAAGFGDLSFLTQICQRGEDPAQRTAFVHGLQNHHPATEGLLQLLADEIPADVQAAVCEGLALTDHRNFLRLDRQSLADRLNVLQSTTSAGEVYSSARVALRRWDAQSLPRREGSVAGGFIHVLDNGITMIRIAPGRSRAGRLDPSTLHEDNAPHDLEITKPFYLSAAEVTVNQFRDFLKSSWDSSTILDREQLEPDPAVSPTGDHPMQRVSWPDAALFCNWLSERENLRPRYQIRTNDSENATAQEITIDAEANGYRLPTEGEWEFACRAGTTTDYFFGNDIQLLKSYGAFSNSKKMTAAVCSDLLPNRNGLSGMHGNVWEWCEDWWSNLDGTSLTDPHGPHQPDSNRPNRVFRGGGVSTMSGEPNSGSRGNAPPNTRYSNLGFRIARPTK
jgi:formylglycine-generating enzyme required for sulfatase activity/serine/threonine protein kinase